MEQTLNSRTRLTDILDGTSATMLFAEVKRGASPDHDQLDVIGLLPNVWDNGNSNPTTNPNNLSPPAACEGAGVSTLNYTGLEYYRGFFTTALYTHTVPPNYRGHDCIRYTSFDQGHLAARSYHPGGVNGCCADGAVHFISDGIQFSVWQALGTRCGGEPVELVAW